MTDAAGPTSRGRSPAGPTSRGRSPAGPPPGGTGFRARRRTKRRARKARIRAMSRPRRYLRRTMIGGTWLLGLVAAGMVAVIVAYFQFTDVPRPETLPLQQVATVQYADGSTLARIGSQDRTIVALDRVPAHVRWAVLAAEDRGFYSEPGVSVRGTVRAAVSDATGGDTQGGSGITQQYVRNAYADVGTQKTLTRKLKELMIAVKLARDYAKNQILEFYLNTVYFGRGAYGIQAAAQAFFGVDVDTLTVAQGALLAGLLRAPSYYDPASNPGEARGRWQYVLDGMVTTHHLSAGQEAALAFPTTIAPKGTGLGTSGWKYLLVRAVLAELHAHGISDEAITDGGLQIRTTIEPKAQRAALSAIGTTFAHLTGRQRNLKNSLVAVDPRTGGVLAYYGGTGPGVRGHNGTVDYNDWASRSANPPGSSFKPYTLATVLTQTLHQTPGRRHLAIDSDVDGSACRLIEGTKICNDPSDDAVSSARVELALAMKYSLNTTFDQLAADAGPANVAATAHAMGVAATDPAGARTLVDSTGATTFGIGIGDFAVTVLDQASGYATLANHGVRNNAYLVERATASDGDVVYRHRAAPVRAIDARVANDVTMTLEPVARYAGDPLADGRESAAKTGTEGIGTTLNNSDAWMVGFTPQVSAAVWVGTGYRRPILNAAGRPLYGSDLPGRTWRAFLDTYLQGTAHATLPHTQQIDEHGRKPQRTTSHTETPTSGAPSRSTTRPASPGTGAASSTTGPTATPTGSGTASSHPTSPSSPTRSPTSPSTSRSTSPRGPSTTPTRPPT